MDLASVAAGLVVLLLGRPLFWLFVGIMGFLVGFDLAGLYLADERRVIALAVAVGAGLVGIVLALLLQWVAFGVAGFLAGGYLAVLIGTTVGWQASSGFDVMFVVGGVLGTVAALVLADWALILFSSTIGAAIVAEVVPVESPANAVIFIALALVGILVQRSLLWLARRPQG